MGEGQVWQGPRHTWGSGFFAEWGGKEPLRFPVAAAPLP